MKGLEFKTILLAGAKGLGDAEQEILRSVVDIFHADDQLAVSRRVRTRDFLARLSALRGNAIDVSSTLRRALAALPLQKQRKAEPDFHSLLTAIDLATRENQLSLPKVSRSSSASGGKPTKGRKNVDTSVVDYYVTLLESVIREPDAFLDAYMRLSEDKRVKQPEAALIAKKVYGHAPSSTPRKDALRLIKERYISLEDHQAKGRAQSGKSAA